MIIDTQQLMRIKPCLYYNQIYNDSFSMNIHKHNTLEIMYVYNGIMTIEFMSFGGKKETADVMQGQFVLVKPNLPHKISFPQKSDSNVLNIEFECRDPLLKIDNIFFVNSATRIFPQAAQLSSLFRDILLFNDTKNFIQSLLNLHETLSMELSAGQFELIYTFNIFQLLTSLLLCENVYGNKSEGNIYINKAVMFMQKKLHEDVTLDEIAAATGCSAVYLEKLFKKHYGVTVGKKLNELRVIRAKHMLRHFSLPVKEIGLNIGFANTQSFINNFKTVTGLTPNEYRNKKQLEYKHIRAYEQSYFDEKFNSFLTFDKGIMTLGENIDKFINDGFVNSYLYDGSENLSEHTAAKIKEAHKFIFADADAFGLNKQKLKDFLSMITEMQLFDNFIGFYARGDSQAVAQKIRFIYEVSPLKRMLIDMDGQIPPANVAFMATDILLSEENYEKFGQNENIIVWLKLDARKKPLQRSYAHHFMKTNFGGIVYRAE